MNWVKCIILAVLFLTSACVFERRTEVGVTGDSAPIFTLTGSGDLVEAYIYEPGFEGPLSDESHAIWKIQSEKMPGRPIEQVRVIRYGVVPAGFKQAVPKGEEPPLPLQDGTRYKFNFVTGNAPGVKGYFEIKENMAVLVETWH